MLPTRNAMSAVSAMSENIRAEEQETDYHAVVWLDHDEAHVIYFSADVFDPRRARPEQWSRHLRPRVDNSSWTSATAEPEFFFEVAKACEDAKAVVLAGLSAAKTEFVKYLHRHSPETLDRISGIETMARMTDNQLITEARRLFDRTDGSRSSLH